MDFSGVKLGSQTLEEQPLRCSQREGAGKRLLGDEWLVGEQFEDEQPPSKLRTLQHRIAEVSSRVDAMIAQQNAKKKERGEDQDDFNFGFLKKSESKEEGAERGNFHEIGFDSIQYEREKEGRQLESKDDDSATNFPKTDPSSDSSDVTVSSVDEMNFSFSSISSYKPNETISNFMNSDDNAQNPTTKFQDFEDISADNLTRPNQKIDYVSILKAKLNSQMAIDKTETLLPKAQDLESKMIEEYSGSNLDQVQPQSYSTFEPPGSLKTVSVTDTLEANAETGIIVTAGIDSEARRVMVKYDAGGPFDSTKAARNSDVSVVVPAMMNPPFVMLMDVNSSHKISPMPSWYKSVAINKELPPLAPVLKDLQWFHQGEGLNVRERLAKAGVCATQLIMEVIMHSPHHYKLKHNDSWFGRNHLSASGMHQVLFRIGVLKQESGADTYQLIYKKLQNFSGTFLFLKHSLDHGEFPVELSELQRQAVNLRTSNPHNPERLKCDRISPKCSLNSSQSLTTGASAAEKNVMSSLQIPSPLMPDLKSGAHSLEVYKPGKRSHPQVQAYRVCVPEPQSQNHFICLNHAITQVESGAFPEELSLFVSQNEVQKVYDFHQY